MKITLIDSIKEYIYGNINWQLFLTTSFIFIVSLIYFLYRNYHLLDNLPFNHNQNENENINNNNNPNQSNQNDFIDLEFQFEEERKEFKINKNEFIKDFVNREIKTINGNHEVYLFFQGQILDQNKQFKFYEHRFVENAVILCKNRTNQNNYFNRNHYNDSNYNEIVNDPKSVSLYTLITHFIILIIFLIIVFSYKTFNEIFSKTTIHLVQIMSIIWVIYLSDTLSKLIFYRKIVQ